MVPVIWNTSCYCGPHAIRSQAELYQGTAVAITGRALESAELCRLTNDKALVSLQDGAFSGCNL